MLTVWISAIVGRFFLVDCSCPSGFTDLSNGTCTDIDECASGICPYNSLCFNTIGSYYCQCKPGFRPTSSLDIFTESSQTCGDVDECSLIGYCPKNSVCFNINGSYYCQCKTGFRSTSRTTNFTSVSEKCTDVNECRENVIICGVNTICSNTIGNYFCTCKPGYKSSSGEENFNTTNNVLCEDVNECEEDQGICGSNATCRNTDGSYRCDCHLGFSNRGNSTGHCSGFQKVTDCTALLKEGCGRGAHFPLATGSLLVLVPFSHFPGLSLNPARRMQANTKCMFARACSKSQACMRKSYTMHSLRGTEASTCSIIRSNVAGALHSPKGMTVNCQSPLPMEKAIFGRPLDVGQLPGRNTNGLRIPGVDPVLYESLAGAVLIPRHEQILALGKERPQPPLLVSSEALAATLQQLPHSMPYLTVALGPCILESALVRSAPIGPDDARRCCHHFPLCLHCPAGSTPLLVPTGLLEYGISLHSQSQGLLQGHWWGQHHLSRHNGPEECLDLLQESRCIYPQFHITYSMIGNKYVIGSTKCFEERGALFLWFNSLCSNKTISLNKRVNIFLKHKRDENELICVYWKYGVNESSWSQSGLKVIHSNETHTVCSSNHLTTFAVIMATKAEQIEEDSALSVIEYVFVITSLICLGLAIITFVFCKSVQKGHNTIHLHLSLCLFMAHLLLLTGGSKTENKMICAVIAGVLHFLFLASFVWMCLEGVQLLLLVTNLRVVKYSSRNRLTKRYLFPPGYGIPAVIVAVSAGVCPGGYGTQKSCWLSFERAFAWSFLGPVSFFISVNIIMFAIILWALKSQLSFINTDVSKVRNTRLLTFKAMAHCFIMGCSWILGFFQGVKFFSYMFVIVNSLQGPFIFLVHCVLNQQIRAEYRRWLRCTYKKKYKSESSGVTMRTLADTNTTDPRSK
ncbi:adhesion G protein-coupled receptor E2-like [Lepisosteus oculatus]|uniref:adhesion G protein-coupled receptor E2-like n=1 Tax=Lepisosteus oculatus TaxID=7918 RepID=UPI0035F5116B